MTDYVVLRDLSRATTRGPFERGRPTRGPGLRPADVEPAAPSVTTESLTPTEVRSLARDPEVRAMAPVMPTRLIAPVEASDAASPEATTTAWGVDAVGASTSSRTGDGVAVAVLDTGIDAAHPAFAGVTLVQQDFTGDGDGDRQGHGSHCAGTILGRDVDGTRIGVARGVSTALIGKVLGDDGSGDSTGLFRGIQWAVEQGARVISMSLGFDFPGLVERLVQEQGMPIPAATSAALEGYRANLRVFDTLMELVRNLEPFGGGTVVCAAAGNESNRGRVPDYEIGVSLPAAADGVVSVGALGRPASGDVDKDLTVAFFSNTFPEVSAPGVGILSVKAGGGLRTLNGTSMATPHVAGVAALWWEEVLGSPLPARAAVVTSRMVARARTDVFASGVDVADRGAGLVMAPQ